jgi:hypothetical protein
MPSRIAAWTRDRAEGFDKSLSLKILLFGIPGPRNINSQHKRKVNFGCGPGRARNERFQTHGGANGIQAMKLLDHFRLLFRNGRWVMPNIRQDWGFR